MEPNGEQKWRQGLEQNLSTLLGEHYEKKYWEDFVSQRGTSEVWSAIDRLKEELEKADSAEAKEEVRKTYSRLE